MLAVLRRRALEQRLEVLDALAVEHRLRDAGEQQVRMRRAVGQPELDRLGADRPSRFVGRHDRQPDERLAVEAAPRHGVRRFLRLHQADEGIRAAVAEGHERAGHADQPADQPPRLGGQTAVARGVAQVDAADDRRQVEVHPASGVALAEDRLEAAAHAVRCARGCGAPTA